MSSLTPLTHDITLIDTGFVRPGLAASYLMVESGRAAFIEAGTARTVERLLDALAANDLDAGDVDLVIVTHVHLDHAAGAGVLMRQLPNARLVAHPRAARHLIDPAKLMAGATAVYGRAHLHEMFGEMVPVPAERVIEAPDEYIVELAGRPLTFLDTPGHARHHFCVWDPSSRGVFPGDTFGLSYRELDGPGGPMIFPTSSPVQFDPQAMHASIDRLMTLESQWMYMTHFGRLSQLEPLAVQLHELIDAYVSVANETNGHDRHARLGDAIMGLLLERVMVNGCALDEETCRGVLAMDVELNTQGLEIWLDRRSS